MQTSYIAHFDASMVWSSDQDKVVTISAIDGGQPWRRTMGDDNIVYTDWQRITTLKPWQVKSKIKAEWD